MSGNNRLKVRHLTCGALVVTLAFLAACAQTHSPDSHVAYNMPPLTSDPADAKKEAAVKAADSQNASSAQSTSDQTPKKTVNDSGLSPSAKSAVIEQLAGQATNKSEDELAQEIQQQIDHPDETAADQSSPAAPNPTTSKLNALVDAKCAAAKTSKRASDKMICELTPVAVQDDAVIFRQRLEVIRLQLKAQSGAALLDQETTWLAAIKKQYGLKETDSSPELLKRVDIIPLALLLGQLGAESGFGTNTYSKEGNALFSITGKVSDPTCIPDTLHPKTMCYVRYASHAAAVGGYIKYLNTSEHPFTTNFRNQRAAERAADQPLDSLKLAIALKGYADVKGKTYTNLLQKVITEDHLTQFDLNNDALDQPVSDANTSTSAAPDTATRASAGGIQPTASNN